MTTPDQQTARDFARRAILSSAEDVDFMGIAEQFCDDENWPADEDEADAMHDAIEAERQTATVTLSWPDEQQPADPVSGGQQDGAVGEDMCTCNEPRKVCELRTELDRVHGQLKAATARIAELEGEREADVQAVGMLLRFGYMPSEGNWMTDADAAYALHARFADRIAAPAGDETDGSGT